MEKWGKLFVRFIVGKKPPNLIRWLGEEKPTFFNKNKQTINLDGQGEAIWKNKQKLQFFLVYLLLLLAGQPRFCLVINLAIGLTVGLVKNGAKLIGEEVVVGFLGWSFVEQSDQFPEMLNSWKGLPSVFSFRVALPSYKVIEAR